MAPAPDTGRTPGHASTGGARRRAGHGRGGAAARESRPSRVSWAVYLVVLALCLGGLAWTWQSGTGGLKRGTLAVAGATFVAALARLVLPESRAGMLASRKRFTDVVTLAALGAGLLAAGLLLRVPS